MRSLCAEVVCQLLDSVEEKEVERALQHFFILPEKVIRAEWHKSFSLDEMYKSKLQRPK